MPKMKTKSSAKKRFTVTGTKPSAKRLQVPHSDQEGTKQKRNLTQTGLVSKADTPNIKTQLGI